MNDPLFSSDFRPELLEQATQFAKRAIRAGADAAEVTVSTGSDLEVKVRKGKPEHLQEASHRSLGLRLFFDHKTAVTYTSDFSDAHLDRFFQQSLDLCRLSEPDPFFELPSHLEFQAESKENDLDLSLWDDASLSLSAKEAIAMAQAAEAAAFSYSPKITNSEGATFHRSVGGKAYACADQKDLRFAGVHRGTVQSLSVEPICDDADGKKRNGSDYTVHRFLSCLRSPEEVGAEAAKRTVLQLGSKPIKTQSLPIVFSEKAARSLLQLLFSVVSGSAIYRQTSYLSKRQGSQMAAPCFTLIDDPLLFQGLGSRTFDGEGLPSRKNTIVKEGALNDFLLDTYSARKLQRLSNACAGRSGSGAPYVSFSNLVLARGLFSLSSLMDGISQGFYVTDLMGFGFQPITGDFSRGASGFLIKHGTLGPPVSEVTISANFDDLLKNIDAIGSELHCESTILTPPFRVSNMMVSGI